MTPDFKLFFRFVWNVHLICLQKYLTCYSQKHDIAIHFKLNFRKKCLFIWETRGKERGREIGRENPKQALHCQHRAQHRARTHDPWDHDLSQNQEFGAYLTEPLRGPWIFFFFKERSELRGLVMHLSIYSFHRLIKTLWNVKYWVNG